MTTNNNSTRNDAEKLAKTIAATVGAVFLLVGILGFIPGVTADHDTMEFANHHSDAKLLGIFEVSVLHNIVHLLFGVAGLAAARVARHVPTYLFASAAIYLVLTIYGVLIDKDSSANFVPVNSADNWLHLALAAGMAALGLVVKKKLDDSTATNR